MGCGASMQNTPTGKKVRATRINPRLHRRIEDFKRRRHARSLKKITPSKKELLRHRSNEDVGEIVCHFNPLFEEMQKSTHSREDIDSCVTSEESKNPSEKFESLTPKVDERLMQNVPIEGTFEGNVGDEGVEKGKDQIANAEDGDGDRGEEDGMGDDRDDERRIGYNTGVFPGSPSFRIYYVENVDNDKNESDNDNQQLEESTDSVQNVVRSEVAVSLKDAMTMTMPEKKGRKRSGFAKAMKGRKLRCY